MERSLTAEAAYARFFDIEIRKDDQKIEPAGTVSVTIELADAPEEKGLNVVHFTEEGTEQDFFYSDFDMLFTFLKN